MTLLTTGILANCVDCGYDLRGQQESARCPECGRLNIPEVYRQEVHDLVDSGRWFFSSPLSLFAKRPPGWFWSLDRPGDVGRSFRRAGVYMILSLTFVVISIAAANSCALRCTGTRITPAGRINAVTGRRKQLKDTVGLSHHTWLVRAFGIRTSVNAFYRSIPKRDAPTSGIATSVSLAPTLDRAVVAIMLLVWVALIGTWLFPAMVGLWTQVRKGLPGFARASSTVIAACNYEAHRLVYGAALAAVLMVIETLVRFYAQTALFARSPFTASRFTTEALGALFTVVTGYTAIGWLGALRSDFTKQIVRSRWHAARIIWMYSIGFTAVLTLNTYLLLRVLHLAG